MEPSGLWLSHHMPFTNHMVLFEFLSCSRLHFLIYKMKIITPIFRVLEVKNAMMYMNSIVLGTETFDFKKQAILMACDGYCIIINILI